MPVRPCWHQLKGKLFKAELLFTFWHVKSSSPLYAKASHNNHQTVTAMPQSAQIRRWLALKPSFKRGPKETQGAGFLPQVQSSTPHPLFSSSISWVTITEYLMRACVPAAAALWLLHTGRRADYTDPSKQHNTASTLHLMITRELRRIARLPVLF